MKTALIVIAVCEVIRIIQNFVQLLSIVFNSKVNKNYLNTASKAFVESLHKTDKDFLEQFLRDFKESEEE